MIPNPTRKELINRFGEMIVNQAEYAYEVYADQDFWSDLTDDERIKIVQDMNQEQVYHVKNNGYSFGFISGSEANVQVYIKDLGAGYTAVPLAITHIPDDYSHKSHKIKNKIDELESQISVLKEELQELTNHN